MVEPDYLKGRKVYGQIVCSFRYGREEDEVMGLEFQKDLLMASGEIKPTQKAELTKMQVIIQYSRHQNLIQLDCFITVTTNVMIGSPDEEIGLERFSIHVRPAEECSAVCHAPTGSRGPGEALRSRVSNADKASQIVTSLTQFTLIRYTLRVFVGENMDDRAHKRSLHLFKLIE